MFSIRPLEALNAFIPFSCSRLYDLSTRWYLEKFKKSISDLEKNTEVYASLNLIYHGLLG